MRYIKEFRIIDIPLGFGSALHPIYVKQHFDKFQSKKDATTLFIGNIDYGNLQNYSN